MTLGWSQSDAHEYKNNKVTICGNIGPSLRDASLPTSMKVDLLNIIKCALATIPKGCSFNIEEESDIDLKEVRKNMIAEFERALGGNGSCNSFAIEGITILIPLSVGFHKDTNNCNRKGMECAIQVNSTIPINSKTVGKDKDSVLLRWLQSNGYVDSFPCSMILYSRKCVSSICSKMSKMNQFARKDDLRKCLKWAIVDRVDSHVNYETHVWNNDRFCTRFLTKCYYDRDIQNRSFQGKMMRVTASYQKIVSHKSS